MDYPKHGLSGKLKQQVFDALLERQRGKCFFCWISQAELEAKQWKQLRFRSGLTLHIDHCHTTGMIRGLLCGGCNLSLAVIENYGIGVEDDYMPSGLHEDEAIEHYTRMIESGRAFLDQYRTIILLYMQRERWFPRKDILFHLQARQ